MRNLCNPVRVVYKFFAKCFKSKQIVRKGFDFFAKKTFRVTPFLFSVYTRTSLLEKWHQK